MGVKRTILAAVAASFLAVPASAAVVQSQTGVIEKNGETLKFKFNNLAPTSGGGVLNIASGVSLNGGKRDAGIDLDGEGFLGFWEYFNVYVDGGNMGRYTCGGGSGKKIRHTMNGAADCIFSLNIRLNAGQMAEALADGMMRVVVRFGAGVGHHFDADELKVSLRYKPDQVVAAVPLPASAVMLLGGIGLAGFAARRRKSKS